MQLTRTQIFFRISLVAVGAAILAGCTSSGTLRSAGEDASIRGTIVRQAFLPDRVEIRLDGKTYIGEWKEEALPLDERQKVDYSHRTHVGRIDAMLTAKDGAQMRCLWRTHGNAAEGKCTVDGRNYSLKLE